MGSALAVAAGLFVTGAVAQSSILLLGQSCTLKEMRVSEEMHWGLVYGRDILADSDLPAR
jgi:hypothetical protein